MDTIRLFTHGILVREETMRRFSPNAVRVGPATLHGWRHADVTPADVEEAPGEEARGVVWDVPLDEMEPLDHLEGVDHGFYEHVTVEPVLDEGGETAATMYRMVRRARLREARDRYRRECDEGVELLAERGDL